MLTKKKDERAIQTVKCKLKALLSENPTYLEETVHQRLSRHRVSSLASEKSPVQLYMGRQLRTMLHLLKTNPRESTPKQQGSLPILEYKVGSTVFSRNYIGTQNRNWEQL